jgi:hypothetical protein
LAEVPQNSSMLDALNAAGFEGISDCQRGECGVCAEDVVAVGSVVKTARLIRADSAQTCLRTWTYSPYRAFDPCSISLLREAARCSAHFIPLCSWHWSQATSLVFE